MKNIMGFREMIVAESNGPKPNRVEKRKLNSALIKECIKRSPSLKEAEALLDAGADLHYMDKRYGLTPIHWAAASNDTPDLVRLLLDRGASVDEPDSEGDGPLYRSVSKGRLEVAKLLLDRGADVNKMNFLGGFPINYVSSPEMANLLLDRGADVNAGGGSSGKTALDYNVGFASKAIEKSSPYRVPYVETAKVLILRGADLYGTFKDAHEVLDFFDGDLDWMPNGPMKNTIRRVQRSQDLFGED